ncbi:hypothetical protein HNY73_017952 [Argiope bruennichi]|uniref:Uncharacterized protein n=1 Tax=Argiope bruennichi TaxID=94029 RepID=A0A8T0EBD4_ARGBR|nr:hypothetical protein HNY73_017952 [Argiope bruennichi]
MRYAVRHRWFAKLSGIVGLQSCQASLYSEEEVEAISNDAGAISMSDDVSFTVTSSDHISMVVVAMEAARFLDLLRFGIATARFGPTE